MNSVDQTQGFGKGTGSLQHAAEVSVLEIERETQFLHRVRPFRELLDQARKMIDALRINFDFVTIAKTRKFGRF